MVIVSLENKVGIDYFLLLCHVSMRDVRVIARGGSECASRPASQRPKMGDDGGGGSV